MSDTSETFEAHLRTQAVFATTHWSVVLQAKELDSDLGRAALERLCQTYWPPVYAFLRRRGSSPVDAQDLTQGFFSSLLRHQSLSRVSPEKGKFRSFLLAAVRHFLADEFDRSTALKRGGGITPISMDEDSAEAFYVRQISHAGTPDVAFEKLWAQALLQRAQERLEEECRAAGKQSLFQDLGPHRAEDRDKSYAEIAAAHRMTEGAARAVAHRMRLRYQELIRDEVSQTVGSPEEVDGEVRHLIGLFSEG
jgi:RNA polymerase sigma factor (sigma-70 family)